MTQQEGREAIADSGSMPARISIITVVWNGADTILDAVHSVAAQSYPNIEHIVIDGASTDGTLGLLEDNRASIDVLVSEPDDGIYDAMNKGVQRASGEVIGILNADDVYQHNDVLSRVMAVHANADLDACYANLVYVDKDDMSKVKRVWRSRDHVPSLGFTGWMPAHPTLFLKRRVYEQCGLYDTELKIQSDLEFCVRVFEKYRIRSQFIDELWVRMREGGASNRSLRNRFAGNWESYQALRKLGLKKHPIVYFYQKFSQRIPQLFVGK